MVVFSFLPTGSSTENGATPTKAKGRSGDRAAMAAFRLRQYQERFSSGKQLAPAAGGFVASSDRHIVAPRSVPLPVSVEKPQPLFNPEQIDGVSDMNVLPELKPSAVSFEVPSLIKQ